ncbi:MAG TPA: signal peptide protein [Terracidiphilus sp.]|nr:signal peptide protein [Terracidiphilus sp.]
MKTIIRLMALVAALLVSQLCMAQAPAGAPAGATGLCNDGTYFKGSIKLGACSGHKGLKTWYGLPKATPAAKPAPTPAAAAHHAATTATTSTTTAAQHAATTATTAATTTAQHAAATTTAATAPATKAAASALPQAPGGGPGMVWLNTASNVYHCSGSTYYGKTKAGAYMTEDQAKAKGAHANGGKPCGK